MSLASLPTLLLIPPLNCLVAACTGALFHRRRAGPPLLWTGLAGLVVFSIPAIATALILSLGTRFPPSGGDPPQAIVILAGNADWVEGASGGTYTVGWLTLERERAGAVLARATGLPVLVSGGAVEPGAVALSGLMADSLAQDFAVSPKWREDRSQDTWENAERSAEILRASGIGSVYVVTHAWHMRRALIAFRAAGLRAVAASVPADGPHRFRWESLVPRASAWEQSYFALHEWIGCAWYSLRA